jgi:hypothetical protein
MFKKIKCLDFLIKRRNGKKMENQKKTGKKPPESNKHQKMRKKTHMEPPRMFPKQE